MTRGATPSVPDDPTHDDDITESRARPNGNTADHVNEAGHKKFMGNLKGILKANRMDIKDEIWLRRVVSRGLSRRCDHIGELTQMQRDKAWSKIAKMTEEDFIRLRSAFDQEQQVSQFEDQSE